MRSSGFSPSLFTNGAGLIARNPGAAELNQAAAHLTHGVLAGIPRPIERRQRDRQDPGREELEQQTSHAQKQRPAAHVLSRAALIVAQPWFYDFIEVDFNLEATGIGVHGLHGIERQRGPEQIPACEGEPRDGDDDHAGGQRPVGPHAAQEDFGITDGNDAHPAASPQQGLSAHTLREEGEELIDPTRRPEHGGAALARRATARGKRDTLITAQAPQRNVTLDVERPQQRAAENPVIQHANMAHSWEQAPVLSQGPDQGQDRVAFDFEQDSGQGTGPLSPLQLTDRIDVGGKNVAVSLEIFSASGDVLAAMKSGDRGDTSCVGLVGMRGISDPNSRSGNP